MHEYYGEKECKLKNILKKNVGSRNTQSAQILTNQNELNIYMYCPNATCPLSHHQNGFMAKGGLGHTHAELHPRTPMLHMNCTWVCPSAPVVIKPLW